ncbi:MAG: hypothetical protein RL522_2137 [Pseudomonadota bacterium]|jgi:DedD protein
MAFFKFRKTGADSDALAAQPESIEALRKRAKQRLIGASILVLVGVIGFPLVFDTQPRPIPVDIPIDIPDRGKTPGVTNSAVGAVSVAGVAASAPAAPAPAPAFVPPVAEPATAKASTPAAPAAAAPAPASAAKPAASPATASAPAAANAASAATRAASAADGDRAKALLEGKPASAAASGRFVVQVGAFADVARAREARQKLEKAGLKTYTQVAETKEGKRIRVRVGPFESRDEAEKAATKVKGLELPATVLTL